MTTIEDVERLEALRERADALAQAGDLTHAVAAVDEGRRLAETLEDDASLAWFGTACGVMLADAGKCAEAIGDLELWLPRLVDTQFLAAAGNLALGRCLVRRGDRASAARALLAASELFALEERWEPHLGSLVEALEAGGSTVDPDGARLAAAIAVAERLAWDESRRRLTKLDRAGGLVARVKRRLPPTAASAVNKRVDEALTVAAAGDQAEAAKQMSQLIAGLPRLHPATNEMRLELLLRLSGMLFEAHLLAGQPGRGCRAIAFASEIASENLSQVEGVLLTEAIKVLSLQAMALESLGDQSSAHDLLARAEDATSRIEDERLRMIAVRAVGIACRPPDDRRLLDRAVKIAARVDDPAVVDVFLDRAKVEDDPKLRLEMLQEVLSSVPAALASARERADSAGLPAGVADGLVTTRVAVVEALVTEALAVVDPAEAARRVERIDGDPVGIDAASAESLMLAAHRLGRADLARRYVPVVMEDLLDRIDAALASGKRSRAFEQLWATWRACIDTLLRAPGADGPERVFRLVDAANRGALGLIRHRGASSALLVDDRGVATDLYRRAVAGRQSPREPVADAAAGLGSRIGVEFVCLEHLEGQRLDGLRLIVTGADGVEVEPFTLEGDALQFLELSAWASLPTASPLESWSELGRILLGASLLGRLHSAGGRPTVVIVPGSSALAAAPWPGLHDGDRYLVELADVQVAPALTVLAPGRSSGEPSKEALTYVPDLDIDLVDELGAWASQGRWRLTEARTRAQLVAALAGRNRWAVGHFATHGSGVGIEQALLTGEGDSFGFADAMRSWWPDVTVFAACHVGRFDQTPGYEPHGLPFACLLRGARIVVGPVVQVGSRGTSTISTRLIEQLADGAEPVGALADCQRWFLGDQSGASLNDWAAMQAISLQ